MIENRYYEEIKKIVGAEDILQMEDMKRHTTFRIGGPADLYVTPQNEEQIQQMIVFCKKEKLPYFVLGNGSNLLVGDKGIRGVVIQIYKNYNGIEINGTVMTVKAGTLLGQAAKTAMENSLGGMEFAAGIPGTFGGAVVMNAGAYGGEMKDILTSARVMDKDGHIFTIPVDELELGYRTSVIKEKEYIVLEATIQLEAACKETILDRMNELKEQRVSKQPLEYPSAGSTFKRPEGYFAGKLIMDAGLRGFCVGGAQVSEKHCGFVINRKDATAKDVCDLMEQVNAIVYEKYQVKLEPEVKMVGEF